MTHRVEQILVAFTTAITGLATTGARVARDRVWDVNETPALSVRMGGEEKIADVTGDQADYWQEVIVVASVEDNTTLSTVLNQIRSEITVALQADYTLGLAFVIDIEELDAEAPELASGETPTATMIIPWRVQYRRSRTNPG